MDSYFVLWSSRVKMQDVYFVCSEEKEKRQAVLPFAAHLRRIIFINQFPCRLLHPPPSPSSSRQMAHLRTGMIRIKLETYYHNGVIENY